MSGCLTLTDESADAQGSVRQLPGSWPAGTEKPQQENKTPPNKARREHMSSWFCVVIVPEALGKVLHSHDLIALLPTALRDGNASYYLHFADEEAKVQEVKHLNLVQGALTMDAVLRLSPDRKFSLP